MWFITEKISSFKVIFSRKKRMFMKCGNAKFKMRMMWYINVCVCVCVCECTHVRECVCVQMNKLCERRAKFHCMLLPKDECQTSIDYLCTI